MIYEYGWGVKRVRTEEPPSRSCFYHDPFPCVSVTVAADEVVAGVVAAGLSTNAGTSAAAVSISPDVLSCADATGEP